MHCLLLIEQGVELWEVDKIKKVYMASAAQKDHVITVEQKSLVTF